MDLTTASPFPCACIKESWLVLQILFDKHYGNFWNIFNETFASFSPDKYNITETNIQIFKLWILNGLVQLETFKISNLKIDFLFGLKIAENTDFLKAALETFCKQEPSEEQLRRFLKLLLGVVFR